MPYELSFIASVVAADASLYINDCCWGGDVVRDRLMPVVSAKYEDIWTDQEDWGWFIWFRSGPTRLAIDIFCDDSGGGKFRVRLTSRSKQLFWSKVRDTRELEELRELIVSSMSPWAGSIEVERVED